MKPGRRSRSDHLRLVAAAVGLALLFTFAVLDYYRAFHFGVGATYAAVTLGLPGALLLISRNVSVLLLPAVLASVFSIWTGARWARIPD